MLPVAEALIVNNVIEQAVCGKSLSTIRSINSCAWQCDSSHIYLAIWIKLINFVSLCSLSDVSKLDATALWDFLKCRIQSEREWLQEMHRRHVSKDLRICTANITAWSSGYAAMQDGTFVGTDIVLVQEHRILLPERRSAAVSHVTKLGWRAHLSLAHATANSSSGGVGILFAPWISATVLETPSQWHWLAVYSVCVGGMAAWNLGVFYGSQDIEENFSRVCDAVHLLQAAGQPWIIGGDFNIEASEFEARRRCRQWHFKVFCTSENDKTCFAKSSGTRLDYFIGSYIFEGLITEVRTFDSGLATHRPVCLRMPQFVSTRMVEVVCISKGVRGTPVFGPLPEPIALAEVARLEVEMECFLNKFNRCEGRMAQAADIDKLWASWLEVITRWFEGAFGPHGGFAHGNTVRQVPLRDALMPREDHRSELWSKWRSVTQVVRRMREMVVATEGQEQNQSVVEKAVNKFRVALCNLPVRHVGLLVTTTAGFPNDLVVKWANENLVDLTGRASKLKDKLEKESKKVWKQYVKDHMERGTSAGFKLAKARVDITYAMFKGSNAAQDQISGEEQAWEALWTRDSDLSVLADLARRAPLVKRRTAAEIVSACKQFKLQTSTVDGVHPRMLKHAEGYVVEGFAKMFACFDQGGRWPSLESFVPIRLIPKVSGGLRPIALYRSWFRVYAATLRDDVRGWANQVPDWGINMRPGRRVGDSTYRLQIREDLKMDGRTGSSAEVLADVSKAYEGVDRRILLKLAVQYRYPLHVLFTSVTSYAWPRRLVYDKMVSKCIWPTTGVLAGAMAAPFEMMLYTLPMLEEIRNVPFRIDVTLHVDDLNVTVHGETSVIAAERLSHVTFVAMQALEKAKLKAEKKKMYYITSDCATDLEVEKSTAKIFGGTVVPQVRRLGLGHALGNRQRSDQGKTRFRKAFQQVKRILWLQKMVVFAGTRVMQQGVLTGVLFGIEHFVLPDPVWTSLQRSVVRICIGHRIPAVKTCILMLCLKVEHDPLGRAVMDIICRWAREIWQRFRNVGLTEDHFNAKEIRQISVELGGSMGENGPVGALRWAAGKIGWSLTSLTEWRRPNGLLVDPTYASPAAIRQVLIEDWAKVQWTQADEHMQVATDPWLLRKVLWQASGLQRTRLCQWLAGHLPTATWVNSHKDNCEENFGWCLCGQPDDTQHRFAGCFVWDNEHGGSGEGGFGCEAETAAALAPVAWPGVHPVHEEITCHINGQLVSFNDFWWAGHEPVFVDGSAILVGTPSAAAGAAGYQVSHNSEGLCEVRTMRCSIPAGFVATAVLAEHFAMNMAAQRAPSGGMQLVTDCAAVVTASKQPERRLLMDPRRVHAAFWDALDNLRGVAWMKAHIDEAEADRRGLPKEWVLGNMWADHIANKARSRVLEHVGDDDEVDHTAFLTGLRARIKEVLLTFERLARGHFANLEGMKRNIGLTLEGHRWITWHGKGFFCLKCGSRASGMRTVRKALPCYDMTRSLHEVHGTHKLRCFEMEDGSTVLACTVCWYYMSSRHVRLRGLCEGKPAGDGHRLLKGWHPKKRVAVLGSWKVPTSTGLRRFGAGIGTLKVGRKQLRKIWRDLPRWCRHVRLGPVANSARAEPPRGRGSAEPRFNRC
jgi:hypothetical protein